MGNLLYPLQFRGYELNAQLRLWGPGLCYGASELSIFHWYRGNLMPCCFHNCSHLTILNSIHRMQCRHGKPVLCSKQTMEDDWGRTLTVQTLLPKQQTCLNISCSDATIAILALKTFWKYSRGWQPIARIKSSATPILCNGRRGGYIRSQ